MIDLSALDIERALVVGMGRSGQSAARALLASGAQVDVHDDKAQPDGWHPFDGVWDGLDAVVWSPGVPHTLPKPHPLADAAKARNLTPVCDVDLLSRAVPKTPLVGITGTNGKSTTTALIGHILHRAGRPVAVGGNLGQPVLDLEDPGPAGTFVIELSSYQIELAPALRCAVAVLLNISPDHLDRHGSMVNYAATKAMIFGGMPQDALAVVGVEDTYGQGIARSLMTTSDFAVVPIAGSSIPAGGIGFAGTVLVDDRSGRARMVGDLSQALSLRGAHNLQNAAAAFAVCTGMGVDEAAVLSGVISFPGLAHRQEVVRTLDGISFVNDSKATNANATAKALEAYDQVVWLAGGRAKDDGIGSLRPYFDRMRYAVLYGEAAGLFSAVLGDEVPHTVVETLADALPMAVDQARAAGAGTTVLLSPACASFDQFSDFEQRGDTFRMLVEALG